MSLWLSRSITLAHQVTPPWLLTQGKKSPMWPITVVLSNSMESLLFLGGSISSVKLRPPIQEGIRSQGQEAHTLLVGHWGPLPFPSVDSWTHELWLWGKQCHMFDTRSEHVQPPEGPCPSLQGVST